MFISCGHRHIRFAILFLIIQPFVVLVTYYKCTFLHSVIDIMVFKPMLFPITKHNDCLSYQFFLYLSIRLVLINLYFLFPSLCFRNGVWSCLPGVGLLRTRSDKRTRCNTTQLWGPLPQSVQTPICTRLLGEHF